MMVGRGVMDGEAVSDSMFGRALKIADLRVDIDTD